jgi:hypothetical protein
MRRRAEASRHPNEEGSGILNSGNFGNLGNFGNA